MEKITKLVKIGKIFSTDKEKFVKIQNVTNDLLFFCEKYGILIDNIKDTEGINIEFFIEVPEHSELKSEREFEMCGIYLANQFKNNATTMIEKLWKVLDKSTKLPRIKITYTSTIGSKLTQEESNKKIEEIKMEMKENIYFPFTEDQIY